MPTLALTNNIAFHSLANVDKTFPVVRVFGTIGWIIAGICIGVTGISDTTGIFTLAALCSVALALYSLTLPHTPRRRPKACRFSFATCCARTPSRC